MTEVTKKTAPVACLYLTFYVAFMVMLFFVGTELRAGKVELPEKTVLELRIEALEKRVAELEKSPWLSGSVQCGSVTHITTDCSVK